MRRIRVVMAYEADRYELPVAVADTVTELAEDIGRKASDIYEFMSKHKTHRPMQPSKGTYRYEWVNIKISEKEWKDIAPEKQKKLLRSMGAAR